MSDRTLLDNIEAYVIPAISVAFVGLTLVVLYEDPDHPVPPSVPEEQYNVLQGRYTALEGRLGRLESRLEGCIDALQRPLDRLLRPLGDAGDSRGERVSRVDTVPLDASRSPREPLVAGGYKWSPRVLLDLSASERNPDEGKFGVSMTPNRDGITVEYRVGL